MKLNIYVHLLLALFRNSLYPSITLKKPQKFEASVELSLFILDSSYNSN
jgi:hypothetical protein